MQLHVPKVKHALVVAGLSLGLTLAYHLLCAEHFFGIPLVIFAVLFTACAVIVACLRRQKMNLWALVFLLPAVICAVAEMLYGSHVVRMLGFDVMFVSLALFLYWLTVPAVKWREVPQFGNTQLVADTLLPFVALSSFYNSISLGKRAKHILTGIILAAPLVFMIGLLFASADPLFSTVIRDLFKDWNSMPFISKLIRDAVVLVFITAFIWKIYERTKQEQSTPEPTHYEIGSAVLPTVLVILNALFAVFIAFQISFFFGNQELVQRYGLTYADYARNGFFQLLTVAGIVFALCMLVFYLSRLRERWEKILTLLLILQTYVVILSAGKRLMLYIDAYGLTLSRWWAMVSIIIIAAVLTAVAAMAFTRVAYHQFVKLLVVFALFAFSVPLLFNAEEQIAKYNVDRFLSGASFNVDVSYLLSLSSDALPPLVDLLKRDWPAGYELMMSKEGMQDVLKTRKTILQQSLADWRDAVCSDYKAYKALSGL